MQSHLNRRSFLHATAAVGAAAVLPHVHSFAATNPLGPNDEIAVGMIGSGGRANELFSTIKGVKGVKVVAVADPEEGRAGNLAKKADAKAYQDLRKIVDDPNIHAVFVATCNHWHCLAAAMAIQAGKDVYVEKPLSHTQWEGQQVIKAARKYGRMVQVGTQQRSDPMQTELKQFLHAEQSLGKIKYAQANRLGTRAAIGKRSTPLEIPKNVNYDLWLGPAADEPIFRNALQYDWHWSFNTGNGEMGNWGVHVLDDVRNVAYQDSTTLPTGVFAAGGRVAWDDAGDTPNVHYAIFETESFPTLIALSNLAAGKDKKGSWETKGGRPKGGPGSGYVVACEGGYLYGQRGGAEAIDLEGKSIRKFKGGDMQGLHIRNFFDAVRSRDNSKLNAEVKIGHDSSGWCNLANVGYQTAESFNREQLESAGKGLTAWPVLVEELSTQLKSLGVELDQLKVSPKLTFDPKQEKFVGDHSDHANKFLKREQYRKGYEFPEIS